ncbi:Hsp70 family protein [Georgenia sp. EYE_87]|uniref:Hsp70 family protein n=1 Tax=Georgenia sp. EYE_87 TaxID=2853448 RepID=UPI002004B09A|nr:Hsp70 family protein [Georgenia sp. EYE_87]MCK6210923.1 Hsp70 family protein [Georgenia sp. EYE_87]
MPYLLGIDIGTTSTLAATVRPGRSGQDQEVPQLLGLGARGPAVPSVLYLGEDGEVLVGEVAERRTLSHPERVVREVKRRVGDTVPLRFGDLSVTPQDLLAIHARWVVDRATEREEESPAAVSLAVPATWGAYRTGLVREALAGVGLADVTLVGEPHAAARHYLSQDRVPDGAVVAVYDFGGGTFDAAVVRKTGPGTCELLGEPEGLERLGGADLDDLVLGHVAAAVGTGLTDLDPADPGALAALARLRRECTEAKEALSTDAETDVPVLLPDLQMQVRIVRAELEELIAPAVHETTVALAAALESAKVAPEELEAILLVGGSSRIPLVAEVLSAQFARPIAIDTDPQASVAFGAALAALDDVAPPSIVTPAGISRDTVGAATPEEAPPRLAAVGSAFVPELPAARPSRRLTQARVAAVAVAVLGITVITSVAGEEPRVTDAGRSTLSGVVGKLGDSVRPDPPAAAAAERPAGAAGQSAEGAEQPTAATTSGAPMATDAGIFAGRRAEAQATSTVRPSAEGSPSSERSAGTTTEPGAPSTGEKGGSTPSKTTKPGTTAPTRPGTTSPTSPTSPGPSPTSPSPSPTSPSPSPTSPSPSPTTDPPTTQEPTPEPTTPAPSPEPTTPAPSPEPTTPAPPAPQEPTAEPTTQEPTAAPTTQEPTAAPTTQEPAPPVTPDPVPTATATLAEPTEAPPAATPTAGESTAGEIPSPTVAGG